MKPENIFSALSALRQEGRLRQVQDLRMETASLGVDREGKRYIVFNSNDYLGMTHAKEVQEAAAKAETAVEARRARRMGRCPDLPSPLVGEGGPEGLG